MTWEDAVLWLRQQPNQVQLVIDCFFDDPLPAAAERYYKSTEWQAVRKLLPNPPGKALDLGAGRGISSYALAKDGWKPVSLEPDPSNVVGTGAIRALAGETGVDIRVVEEWGEELPFPDETFDLVHCRQVLHHARDLGKLCKEISRVLKKGGMLIATREHVISKKEDINTFLDSHPLHHLYGGEKAYPLSEYISAITRAEIKLIRVMNPFESNINLFPETIAALKKRLAKRISFPWPWLIPDTLLTLLGRLNRTPGRLYSFVGEKKDE